MSSRKFRIYLDFNATTPLSPEVVAHVHSALADWGNPSSVHGHSRGPKVLLRESRNALAGLLECDPLELIFTSCGSEGNNQVLKGVFFSQNKESAQPRRNHYLIGACEHPSVLKAAHFLRNQGAEVEYIPVRRDGSIDFEDYCARLRSDTALVSMMIANNETGSIFPIRAMATAAQKWGALFHADGVQALGKSILSLRDLGVNYATFAGHKFYSLKGAGVLFVKKGSPMEPLIHGGGQERGRRGGTENVLAISSLAVMARQKDQIPLYVEKMRLLRDRMERFVLTHIPDISITGSGVDRLANTSNMVVQGVDGETLLMNLDMLGISVSTGAACSSGSQEPSPVLRAMGLSRQEAQSSLRLSLGWSTTTEDIDCFCDVLKTTVERLRNRQFQSREMSRGIV